MALLFFDGFDHCGTDSAALRDKWTANDPSLIRPTTSSPRTGTACLEISTSNGFFSAQRAIVASGTSVIVGCAFRLGSNSTSVFLSVKEGATDHVNLATDGTGKIQVRRGATVLATTS